MDSLGGNILPPHLDAKTLTIGIGATAIMAAACLAVLFPKPSKEKAGESPGFLKSLGLFFYSCFLKPHSGNSQGSQQDALESFYGSQASIYDSTRGTLLKGREDMLGLVSAQLKYKLKSERPSKRKIWVDVGGGTGFNIEAMAQHIDVSTFFDSVYLVDFSPSLCEIAKKRFERLGWDNVKVICQDARKFRLEDHESFLPSTPGRRSTQSYFSQKPSEYGAADLITMSYSLSMIPDFYSVVDSLTSLLAPHGIIGVVDFYVQSKVDFGFRNYTGGFVNRHINFVQRTFWRAWFDLDRVGLEASRRDYLEYRLGTVLNVNDRNRMLGRIPYYIWLGCHKKPFSESALPHEIVEKVDALVTESPYLYPVNHSKALARAVDRAAPEIRSKAFDAAIQNLAANLPLPSFFYQNHHYRIYYDDQHTKHTQFNDEYIYAFTWEDTRVDERILKLTSDDVILAITSAGDNILSYALQSPARIHAVDLNPTQNHLLELKVASIHSLSYEDHWKLFGEGRHANFRHLLITKMSPHMSSRAFQYWLSNCHIFTSSRGLYDTGGSKHAIRIFRWISKVFGCRRAVQDLLQAKTLNEQREIWRTRIRPALLSRIVSKFVVSQESFLWTALGVPKNQLAMLEEDHANSLLVKGPKPLAKNTRSHAIWHYMVDTLDPVVENTHIAADNPYYLVCLQGEFSPQCQPDYLARSAHASLSRAHALDGLRIHTDEIDEVLARISPGTLTIAVVMDSMDWFDPGSSAAAAQVMKLNRALKMGGRVMCRSSGLKPWYVDTFRAHGFQPKCHGERVNGACIDRVNMYASCWIMTKVDNLRDRKSVV